MFCIYFVVFLDSMLDNFVNRLTMNYSYSMDIVVENNNIVYLQLKLIEI